ncbi:hypothetical protein Dda_4466 [Drechslerella dactyloides]|uniref:Ribosomal RNA-processing protein 12-like conserved domain-containing protein n=1 Tax=Drechslerella dactyloides TaxID=74499 RepID=A0AAD6NJA8_DREDA|nr:hypothetical protein Dda_4466 [Drechslerella dactyloides]
MSNMPLDGLDSVQYQWLCASWHDDNRTTNMASLEEKLDRIRTPNLQNQAQTAIVLNALEASLREEDPNATPTPTAYFSALLSVLHQYISGDTIVNQSLAAAVVYLLDTVTPFAPEALLRAKFSQILAYLAPAITHPDAEAPLLKSSIGCLETLLIAQDATAWNIPQIQVGPKRAVSGLLNLGLDPRPKVRKRALDAIKKILENPPPTPSLDHPATELCADKSLTTLVEFAKQAPRHGQHDPKTIHALQLVRAVSTASGWPSKRIEPLCEVLLTIARSSNELMTISALDVFEVIFESLKDEMVSAKLPKLLEAISELRPSQNDSQLLPPWLTVIAQGYGVAAEIQPEETFEQLPELFVTICTFLESPAHNIRTSASQCLIALTATCIPSSILFKITKTQDAIMRKISTTVTGLLSVRYQGAWREVFDVYKHLFEKLRWKASVYFLSVVKAVGELRATDGFMGKKEADGVLIAAVHACGPEDILKVLPLNLLTSSPDSPGRAWLLPILRDGVQNTFMGHFKREFVPLFKSLFEKVQAVSAAGKEKTMEVKIFETVISQIWTIFPGYCDLPLDLEEAFDQELAELLANVLYSHVELRVSICQGLQNLVESNLAIVHLAADREDDDEDDDEEEDILLQSRVTKAEAKRNIEHLANFSTNMLLVLFNIYNETLPQYRAYILNCADAYLGITKEAEIASTFDKVTTALHQALTEEAEKGQQQQGQAQKGGKQTGGLPAMSHNLMDLVVTIAPYLQLKSLPVLFTVFTTCVGRKEDPQLQKKAYKVIPRICESDVGRAVLEQQIGELQTLLKGCKDSTTSPARRDRLAALVKVVEMLPREDMTFIFECLDEVIQCAKEVNEKARAMAYELLVVMGEKMKEGGVIKRGRLGLDDGEGKGDVEASLEDYVLMVCAGLASPEAHMISATVTAVTRIVWQFKDDLKPETISELVTTMDAFLTSNNREIVRSVLGFVKVSVTSLPKELMVPRLSTLIPNLMTWSHEHKAHFKAKVKHIIERMIRRFGYDVVERNVPEEDRKLVVNIRKTRDRKKRRKQEAGAAGEEDDEHAASAKRKGKFESEFEEAIYGSESEESEGDDEGDVDMDRGGGGAGAKKRKKGHQQFIVEDEEEPLDLLNKNALASISSTRPQGKGKKVIKSDIKTNRAGKFVIGRDGEATNDGDGDDDVDVGEPSLDINDKTIASGEVRDGISAYIQALKGKDAVQRGQRGRLKFSNRRRKDEIDDDMELDDVEEQPPAASKKSKGGKHERKASFGRKGDNGRVQKPPKSPSQAFKQRGGGTASIGRRK